MKKKAKKAGSYALQQLQEEIKKDAEDKARADEASLEGAAGAAGSKPREATSDEDDFLQKTGKTTADAPALEVSLPEKKRKFSSSTTDPPIKRGRSPIVMSNGIRIPIGRSYASKVRQQFRAYMERKLNQY